MDLKHPKQGIKSQFKLNKHYSFQICKTDSFSFRNSKSEVFTFKYNLEINQLENDLFEAYFPSTVYFHLKHLTNFQMIIQQEKDLLGKTIYYQLSKNKKKIKVLNMPELKVQIKKDQQLLKSKLNKKAYNNLKFHLKSTFKNKKQLKKYLLEDLVNIHYCESFDLEESYYMDLSEEVQTANKVNQALLKNRPLVPLRKSSMFEFLNETEEDIKISLFNFRDTYTSSTKINHEKLKKDFINHQMNFEELNNGTFSIHKYIIDRSDHILNYYQNRLKVLTDTLNKQIDYTIQRRSFIT